MVRLNTSKLVFVSWSDRRKTEEPKMKHFVVHIQFHTSGNDDPFKVLRDKLFDLSQADLHSLKNIIDVYEKV
jgi:hypothetical protein